MGVKFVGRTKSLHALYSPGHDAIIRPIFYYFVASFQAETDYPACRMSMCFLLLYPTHAPLAEAI